MPLARGGRNGDDGYVAASEGDVTMARVDTRLRAWGWLTRRMVPIATMKEADVIAMQGRPAPKNAVTNWLFGSVPPEVETTDRPVPGHGGDPGADLPVNRR